MLASNTQETYRPYMVFESNRKISNLQGLKALYSPCGTNSSNGANNQRRFKWRKQLDQEVMETEVHEASGGHDGGRSGASVYGSEGPGAQPSGGWRPNPTPSHYKA
jgi:hypothetical protein